MLRADDVTGVVLVGGKSFRMGRDKALLPLDGMLLIDKVLDTLRGSLQRIILVGDHPERFEGYGLKIYPDIFPGSSLGGLYSGLSRAETPYIFASACDLPFASPSILRLILSLGGGFDAVVPLNGNYSEPLFALYHKNCLETMKKLLDERNYRIYDFYPQVRIRYVTTEEIASVGGTDRAFLNVNTIKEYEVILGRKKHGR
jgi:molybdopterin-guanine dinucleotide biosynthesis protein A